MNGNPDRSPHRAHVLKRLGRARRLIDDEFARPLCLADLARAAFMSEAHFARQFGREFGISPCRYLTERRLAAACRLLEETELSVMEIVSAAGFGNRCAFSRLFKARFGQPPTAWRERRRGRARAMGAPANGRPLRSAMLAGVLVLALLAPVGVPALAAEPAAEAPPPPACTAEAYRQFDFWVGTWDVYANDQLAGTNEIRRLHGGCVLQEHWRAVGGGFSGTSLSLYDAQRERWHQSWVDSSGTLLTLSGGRQGPSMVLEGRRPAKDGTGTVTHRITWTPQDDGGVRQHWEVTRDGERWQSLFDGIYRRVETP